MTPKQLKSIQARIETALAERRYSVALIELKSMAEASGASWEIRMEVEHVGSTYRMLADYALDGVPDPSRADMLDKIDADIRRICDNVMREKEAELSSTLYFNTLRYERSQTSDSLPDMLTQYSALYNEHSMSVFTGGTTSAAMRSRLEALAMRIFSRIWVSSPLSRHDCDALDAFMRDGSMPVYARKQFVSALSLGALEYFDARRIALLADVYENCADGIDVRAICGLLLALWKWRDTAIPSKLQARLEAVADSQDWERDVRTVFMQFIRARDTERVTRTMNDEVIPRMMKLRNDIGKLADIENPEDLAGIEANPEWGELMKKSGIEDELKKLTEMQTEGADVLMSTFSHLKSFTFFNDIANWFLPYHTDATVLDSITGKGAIDYLSLVNVSPMLCDGDKYSMALSLERVPDAQRNMLLGQLAGHAREFENMSSGHTGNESRDREIDLYVKDLYRFYNLFRRKGEFYNPFAAPINLVEIKLLSKALSDADMLAAVSEFYFRHGYFSEALNVYRRMIEDSPLDDSLYQKAGYCLQKLGDIAGALDMYRKGELINPSSTWLLKRIAVCSKMTGHSDEALRYFKQVAERQPDDLNVTMNIGHCEMELGNYSEALRHYYKVEYIKGAADRTSRPIAWCCFLSADYDKSLSYYGRIDEADRSASDWLNMGHLFMGMNRFRDAVDHYSKALDKMNRDMDRFARHMHDDASYLAAAGIDPLMTAIVLDTVNKTLYD